MPGHKGLKMPSLPAFLEPSQRASRAFWWLTNTQGQWPAKLVGSESMWIEETKPANPPEPCAGSSRALFRIWVLFCQHSPQWRGVLRARLPLWNSYPLKRRLLSLQFGVFTRVCSLVRRWGPLTKAPLSQCGLLDGLRQFLYSHKQRKYPESSIGLWLAAFFCPDQSEAFPFYAHFPPSGVTSCLPEDATIMPLLYSNANKYFLTTLINPQWHIITGTNISIIIPRWFWPFWSNITALSVIRNPRTYHFIALTQIA